MNILAILGLVSLSVQQASADTRWVAFKLRQSPAKIQALLAAQQWFDQKIDHFTSTDTRTFKQRFFVDSSLAKGPNAPVIYYLCGEAACEGATNSDLVNKLAKKYGAHRVALEHRYYGTSQPFKTLSSENLKHLSLKQAIEDLADFQKFAQTKFKMTGKWISVGGSYAGELSAFYRLKHPELVVGALASSAPILAKDNFEEYDLHVANVAGADCLKAIQEAVADTEQKLKSPVSALAVKKLFHAEKVKDDVDFLYVLADMAAIAIQYGYQAPFCSQVIEGMKNGKVTEAYAKIGSDLFAGFGITAEQDSFQGAESINPSDYESGTGLRAWMYQSCTEFGFYQVAYSNPAQSSRSSRLTLAYHHSVCKRLFGITQPVDVNKTNTEYYRQLFGAGVKNIFFTNGSNDPWSNLSLTEKNPDSTLNPELKFFTIADAAHCDDLGRRASAALDQARLQFDQLVTEWLK